MAREQVQCVAEVAIRLCVKAAAALISGTGGVIAAPAGFAGPSRPAKIGEYVELYVTAILRIADDPRS